MPTPIGVAGPLGGSLLFGVLVDLLDSVVDELTVLFEVEFLVVADGRVDGLGGIVLIFGVVELGEIRVLEDFCSSGSFLGVEFQHLADEVHGIGWGFRLEPFSHWLHLELVDRTDHRHRHLRV